MQFRITGRLLLGAIALPAAGIAQTTPAPPAITRTVVAATKLPDVTNVPLHFKAVSMTLQPGEKSGVAAGNGILYQMSGSTEVALDGAAKMLNAGEGLFIAGGKMAALTAGGAGPSTLLHFFLAPAGDLDRPVGRLLPRRESSIAPQIRSPTCSQAVMISISPGSHSRRSCLPTRHTTGQERRCTISFPAPGRIRSTARRKQRDRGP